MINEAKGWGFGGPTGIDLPIDGSGSILTRQDKIDAYAKNKALWCSEAATEPNPLYREYDKKTVRTATRYREDDALNFAVGEGTITALPLQLAVAYGALANGGTLFKPRIGKAIIRPDGTLLKTIKAPSTKLPVPVQAGGPLPAQPRAALLRPLPTVAPVAQPAAAVCRVPSCVCCSSEAFQSRNLRSGCAEHNMERQDACPAPCMLLLCVVLPLC